MVDVALVYTAGVLVLFFFWIYGIVTFVRDLKNYVIPAYRQYRRDDATDARADRPDASEGPEARNDEVRHQPRN